jgi:hypothetical protein
MLKLILTGLFISASYACAGLTKIDLIRPRIVYVYVYSVFWSIGQYTVDQRPGMQVKIHRICGSIDKKFILI